MPFSFPPWRHFIMKIVQREASFPTFLILLIYVFTTFATGLSSTPVLIYLLVGVLRFTAEHLTWVWQGPLAIGLVFGSASAYWDPMSGREIMSRPSILFSIGTLFTFPTILPLLVTKAALVHNTNLQSPNRISTLTKHSIFPVTWTCSRFILYRASPFGTWGSWIPSLLVSQLAAIGGIWLIDLWISLVGEGFAHVLGILYDWARLDDGAKSRGGVQVTASNELLIEGIDRENSRLTLFGEVGASEHSSPAVDAANASASDAHASSHRQKLMFSIGIFLTSVMMLTVLGIHSNVPTQANPSSSIPMACITGIAPTLDLDYYLLETDRFRSLASIIVWHEGAVTLPSSQYPQAIDRVKQVAKNKVHVLATFIINEGTRQRNRATFIDPNGDILFEYDKVHPVPIQESFSVIPGETLPPIAEIEVKDHHKDSHGRHIDISVALCHDADYPNYIRHISRSTILLYPTSLWSPSISDYHIRLNTLRAIENGLTIFRCDNHGTSAIIAPNGNILEYRQAQPPFVTNVFPQSHATFYAAVGDYGLLLVVGWGIWVLTRFKIVKDFGQKVKDRLRRKQRVIVTEDLQPLLLQ